MTAIPGKKWNVRCSLIVLLVLASTSASFKAPAQASGQVTIYRDTWGVPHIYAETEEDGFYGWGYAMAEDRLESLLMRYLWTIGGVAAVFGPGKVDSVLWPVPNAIFSDIAQQGWDHLGEARAGFPDLSPQLQKNYRYFMRGIERYMHEHADEVPEWAPELEPALPIAFARSYVWQALEELGTKECRQALPPPPGPPPTAAAEQPGGGEWGLRASNGWAVMPWRTADGAAIYLTDPHMPFGNYGEMYEIRIDAGELKMAGTGLVGVPWLLFAHTPHVAMGVTNGQVDDGDCYEVEVDPQNPRRYRYDDAWKEMSVRELSIAIKGAPPFPYIVECTDHNGVCSPVLGRHGGKAYVASSPYTHRAGRWDEQFYRQALARNVAELLAAQEMVEMFSANFMAADADGNILYVRTGRVPIRPAGYDWTKPVPGNTSKTAWQGIHPLEDLVHIKNPVQGYMQCNNVAPDMMMENSPLSADRYLSYIYGIEPGTTNTRGIRAVELLSRAYNLTLEETIEIALDEKWLGTEAWQEALRRALNRRPEEVKAKAPEFRRFVDRLLHFDGFARKESVAALNYYYWRTRLASDAELSAAELKAISDAVEHGGELTPAWEQALLAGVEQAIAAMLATHNSIDLAYGDVFRIGRGGHSWPLGGGRFMAGDRDVRPLRAMRFFAPPDAHGRKWVQGGQVHTMVVVFTDPIQSFSAHPFGTSGKPDSPHFSDQAQLLSERRLKPTYFYKEDLLPHVVSTTTLDVRVE